MSNLTRSFGITVLFLVLFNPLKAQTTAGSISGQVTDPSGAPVVQATITETSQANGEKRNVQTLPDGTYRLPDMLPGTYDVSVSAPGFNTSVSRNLQLLVNSSLLVDFALKIGDVNQRIDVQATAPLLQTDNSTVGEVVDNKQVVDLPLNGRQFTQLILLTPGAAYTESGQQSAFTISLGAGSISPAVNGQNFTYNNYTLDGLENNERSTTPTPYRLRQMQLRNLSSNRKSRMPGLGLQRERM
jgi:hypothetical protein